MKQVQLSNFSPANSTRAGQNARVKVSFGWPVITNRPTFPCMKLPALCCCVKILEWHTTQMTSDTSRKLQKMQIYIYIPNSSSSIVVVVVVVVVVVGVVVGVVVVAVVVVVW